MSIDYLSKSESALPVLVGLVILAVFFAIPAGLAMAKKINKNIYGDDEFGPISEENNARIIAKRTTPHPLNQGVMINIVVFELVNGSRFELAIKDPNTYVIMVEGDCGTLKYQGKKFVSFERGNGSEA